MQEDFLLILKNEDTYVTFVQDPGTSIETPGK
jgi:hypothetical protein